MDQALRDAVRERAGRRCEYCHLPDSIVHAVFQVDHIVARQHGGSDELENLAWCCSRCNAYKGPNLSGVDADSNVVVTLYHPRQQKWEDHFDLQGSLLIGLTPVGRTTVRLLAMNDNHRVPLRQWLIEDGEFQ
jgi:hypothetical protein